MRIACLKSWMFLLALGLSVGTRAGSSFGAEPAIPPDTGSAAVPAAPNPVGTVRLSDALAAAIAGNTELAEFEWDLRAEDARILQAGLRPNPRAGLTVEDVLGTGSFSGGRQAQTTLEVSQLFELGGKRTTRIGVAERGRDLTRADYELKRAEVAAEVTRRFIRVLAAQQGVLLVRTNIRIGEATLRTIVRRAEAGAGLPLEEKKARIGLARARVAAEHAEHILAVERRELAALWGSTEDRFDRVEADLFERRRIPPYEVLRTRLADGPTAARDDRDRRLREAEARLAASRRVPDLTVSAGIRRLEGPGEEAFLFSMGMPLPLLDRNQGGIAEASALVAKSLAKGRSTQIRLSTVLFGLRQELMHAEIELEALDREILPEAEASVRLAESGFGEGRLSYLEMLDAQRTLAELRRERIEAGLSYQQFVLEIERLIGGALDAPAAGDAGTAHDAKSGRTK